MLKQFRRLFPHKNFSYKQVSAFSDALDRYLKPAPESPPEKPKGRYKRQPHELTVIDQLSSHLYVPDTINYDNFALALIETEDRKKLKKVPTDKLIELNKYLTENPNMSSSDLVWQKLENEYTKRIEGMDISQIAEILWLEAFANRKNKEFFRVLEDGILARDIAEELDYRLIKKILWGFSHVNYGSAELYSTIARHITRVQTEIEPIMLAEYAYYMSKASNNMQGGFGVYHIAEKLLQQRLRDYDLYELRRICEYLLPQSIGSNKFYAELEQRIKEKYPQNVPPSVLVALCKSTFNFRFKTTLFSQMEKSVLNYMEHFSISQLEDVLWGFVKGKRGSEEFYIKISEEFVKRMKLLKPRGVAFSLFGFASMQKGSYELFQKYQEYITEHLNEFSPHYLVKILIGLSKTNPEFYSKDFLLNVFNKIAEFEGNMSFKEVLRVLESMQGLTMNLKNVEWDTFYDKLQYLIEPLLPKATPYELSMFLFHYIASNQGTAGFIQAMQDKIEDINSIPKNAFVEGFFSYVESHDLDVALQFIPVIDELCGYGNIKYFFDHSNFIRLVWGIATLIHANPNVMKSMSNFASQNIKESLLEINLNTLRQDALRLYFQTWGLLKSLGGVEEAEEAELYEKFEELIIEQRNELINFETAMQNEPEIRDEVLALTNEFLENKEHGFTVIKEMSDEFYNVIDVALINEQTLDKVGILILNKNNYLKYTDYKERTQLTRNKISMLEAFEWKLVKIDEGKWKGFTPKEKSEFIQKKLAKLTAEFEKETQGKKSEE